MLSLSVSSHTQEPTAEEINKAFGIPLFSEQPLWESEAEIVAKRIEWPEESRTEEISSYRKYAKPDDLVLNQRPYSMSIHAEKEKPISLSIIFSNKGDHEPFANAQKDARGFPIIPPKEIDKFELLLNKQASELEETLNTLFGPPKSQRVGVTSKTSEVVRRWDWNTHAILLAAPKPNYVGIRIIPVDQADNNSKINRIDRQTLLQNLASRVVTRNNGDVILKGIPMVNQGPKGYCVPATWERYLRYLSIPADMYLLAMTGNSGFGGGTYIGEINNNISNYITRYNRTIQLIPADFKDKNLKEIIDDGFPLMWEVKVEDTIEKACFERSQRRKKVEDWEEWKKQLEEFRHSGRSPHVRTNHVRMIIGYNATTKEIAYSDSWGAAHAEKWMTYEEAQTISGETLFLIRW